MNLNSVLSYKSLLIREKLEEIAKSYFHPEKAFFQEDKDIIESFVETFKTDPIGFFKPVEVTVRDRADKSIYNDGMNNSYSMFSVISILLSELNKEHNKLTGFEISKLNDLEKLKGLIKQKIASLELASNKYKFVWSENFETEDNLILTSKTCTLSGGLLTLPIKSKEEVSISSINIGALSVGQSGSSDTNYLNVGTINNLLAGGTFQWENTNNKNAKLEIEILFAKDEIINAIDIRFLSISGISSALIKSVKAFSKGSLIEVLPDPVTLTSTDDLITFYPILTNKISVLIDQPRNYDFVVTNITSLKRSVISLDKLKLYRIKYMSEGALESKEINIAGAPNASQVSLNIAETNNNLYSCSLLYSIDNKTTYNDSSVIGSYAGIKNLYWKFLVKRNDNSFENTSSVYSNEKNYDYEAQLNYVGSFTSPSTFSLNKKSINDSIFVMQPRIMKRGYKKKEFVIGKGTGAALSIKLGMEISPDLAERSIVRVNGELWTYSKSLIGLTSADKNWTLSKLDYKTIMFGNDTEGASVPDNAVVTFSLDNEKLNFIETDKGFYSSFDFLFDPDKDNIDLFTVSESKVNGKFILAKNKTVNKLPYQNIVSGSVKIAEKKTTGIAYTSPIFTNEEVFVDGDSELVSAGDYSIDYVNGYIYSKDVVPSDDVATVLFSFYPVKEIASSSYEIVYEDSVPKGVLIYKNSFPAEEITDSIVLSPGTTLKNLTIEGLSNREEEASVSTSKEFYLSRSSPIPGTINVSALFSDPTSPEEVAYIDGYSEFLGLIKVVSEYTSSFSGSGIKSFTVTGGANYYAPLGISFDDSVYFLSEKGSLGAVTTPGDWFINTSTGTVSVWVSAGLPAGINYSYFYKTNSFDSTNKYSVNYKRAVIYTLSDFITGGTVTYKSVNFYACYDVVKEIKNYTFDKNNSILTVKTENNFLHSNLIKIIYPVKNNDIDMKDLAEYYSPLVKSFDFRFL